MSLTLLVGFVVSLQQAIRATNAESLANERLEAEQAANQEAKSERDRAEQNLQLALEILDRLYLRTAENELNGKTALTDDEREFLQQILPFYEALTEQQSSSTNSRVQKAHAYYRVGLLYRSLNIRQSEKTPQAESAFVHAIGLYAALVEEFPESAQYHHNLAQSHFYLAASMRDRKPSDSESHFLKAIEIVRGTQKQFPAEATHLLGDFLYKYGLNLWIAWERPHDAIVPLKESLIYREELLKSSPDSISFNYAVVQSLITLGNAHRMSNDHENANICYKNAIDHCDRCVDSGLNSLPIQLALGKAHRNSAMLGTSSREDNFHLGQTAFEKALSFTPSSIETRTQFGAHLEEYALYLESQKRFEDAEEFWRKSVGVLSSLVSDFPHKQWQPVLVSRRKRLVQLLANLGRKDEARAFVDEISVNSSEESMYRSELYIAIGEVDLAMADLNKADELPADNLGKANWRKMRGDLYANDLGEFEKALFDYDEWIKSQGEEVTAESYRVRAEFLAAKMKRYGAAVDDFTRAIELEPNNPELYKARAHEVWVKTRQYDKAVADCDKVIELRGANAIAHDYLFRGLIKGADLGQIDTGLADVEKALEIDPGYADAWGRKGQILVIANRNKEALSAFREMAQLQGYTSWHIWKRYATLAFDEGEVAEAVAALRAALERNPDDHSTLTWLGAERFVKVQKPANKKALLELADHAVVLTGKDDAGVRASRAAVYSFLGRTDFAEEEFDFAIESLPSLLDDDRPHSDNGSSPNRYRETSDALNVTAYYYLLTGHMDLALKRLRQAVMVARNSASRFSHDPWITNNYTALLHELSFVERAVGNASEAEKSEQEFLERMFSASDSNLETTRALYERVLLELYNERLSAASERCQDMWRQTNELESQPSNDIRWALWTTVLVPDALADYSQAIKIARDQQKELPDSFDRQQILGGLLLRTGQFDEGRTHLSKAFTKSDDASSSKAYTAWLLSMTYGALGNPKAAKEWYDKATEMTKAELDPKVIPTWNRRFTLLILQREATERLTASGVLLPSTKE